MSSLGRLTTRGRNVVFSTDPELLVLVLVGWFVRLRQYTWGRSVWVDEATFANNFVEHDLAWLLNNELDGFQSAPAGFISLVKSLSVPLGTSDQALRLVPLLAGLVLVVASAVLARATLNTRPARSVLVGLCALAPVLVYYASEVKQYGSDAAVTIGLLMLVAMRNRWPSWLPTMAVAGAIAVWVSLPAAFTVAACGLLLGVAWVRERRFFELATVGTVWVVSAGLSAYWSLTVSTSRDVFHAYWESGFAPLKLNELGWYGSRAVRLGSFGLTTEGVPLRFEGINLGWVEVVQICVAVVALGGLAFGCTKRGALRDVAVVSVMSIGFALVASMLDAYPFDSRLLVFAVPFTLIGLATAVEAAVELAPPRWTHTVGLVAAIALLAVPAVPTARHVVRPYNQADMLTNLRYIEVEGPDLPVVATAWSGGALVFYSRTYEFAWPVDRLIPLDFSTEPVLTWAAESQPGPTWVVIAHRLEQSREAIGAMAEFAPIVQQHVTDTSGVYLMDFDRAFADRYRVANPG